ncbi:hypothetical protein B0H13DRAFT_1906622 [Mycena leptocephala]|nr:hypothetical protein B0H13DRAFT_1906622 [Mycena leptocephala]
MARKTEVAFTENEADEEHRWPPESNRATSDSARRLSWKKIHVRCHPSLGQVPRHRKCFGADAKSKSALDSSLRQWVGIEGRVERHGSLVSHSLLNGARSTQSIPVLPSHSHLIDHFTPFPIHLDAMLFSKAVHRHVAHPAASSRVDLATPTLPALGHRVVLKEPTFPIDSTESNERDELKEGLGKGTSELTQVARGTQVVLELKLHVELKFPGRGGASATPTGVGQRNLSV